MTPDLEAIRARHQKRLDDHDPYEHYYPEPFVREAEDDIEALLTELARFRKVGEKLWMRTEESNS